MFSQLASLTGYRELLVNFARKELKVKYKNSVLGFFWSLLNPILMMIVFSFVFTIAIPIRAEGIQPYAIFFLAGFLPWNFFNASVIGSTTSIVGNGALIKKVYFPRELLPVSIAMANLVNFALELLVFVAFIVVYSTSFPHFLAFYKYLPFLLVLIPILFMFTVGVSLLVASLNVYYRDIQHLVGIFLMMLFYSTPIIYPVPDLGAYGAIYKANPMTAIVLSFRKVLFEMAVPDWRFIAYTATVAFVVGVFGYFVFLRMEPSFAEEV